MYKIKQGDNVKVMSGKDAGKTGKVSQVLFDGTKVVVDGANKLKKHARTGQEGKKGQTIEFFAPMRIANVQLVCPKCSKVTRVGFTMEGDKKVRACKKCKAVIS